MAKQNKDYGYDIQKLYLEMMLQNAETFVRCQSIFDYSLFDRKLQDTAQFINKYVTEYNQLPTYDIVNTSCSVDLKQTEQLTEEHFDWLLNDFETFVRHKSLERAILKSPIRQINSSFFSCSSKNEAKQFNQLILYSNLLDSREDPFGT